MILATLALSNRAFCRYKSVRALRVCTEGTKCRRLKINWSPSAVNDNVMRLERQHTSAFQQAAVRVKQCTLEYSEEPIALSRYRPQSVCGVTA
jgi:hypothetical protein